MELDRDDLFGCFPEFRPFAGVCRFDDCRHSTEPGCALRGAVESRAVSRRRYESFLALARGQEPARR
jgi:ribosome biogenesis GTPase